MSEEEITTYHRLAKEAGNKLRAYILSVSSGAAGLFFFSLANSGEQGFSRTEKWLLFTGLISFVATIALCLIELRVDARRFFALAVELKKPVSERRWDGNMKFKRVRFWLLHASYCTLGLGVLATSVYLMIRILA
ncbi:hypothetical protein [Acidihalobacter prosperus]